MISQRFERNLGFLSTEEQETLGKTTVAVAGAGGDGGMLSIQLARLGVGNIKLADPDPFEIENINRQAVCTDKTLRKNKAEAVAEYIGAINPSANVEVFDEGISRDNVENFVAGSNLTIDETEFTMPHLGVMLARESREKDVPQLTALNIGFGAIVTTYKPDGRHTLERQLGFGEDQDLDEIAKTEISLSRWLPYIPRYGDISVLQKVASGEKPAPSIAPGVALAAGIGATQVVLNIFDGNNNRPKPTYSPKAIVVDSMDVKAEKIKYSRVSHYRALSSMMVRNLVGLNPKANY
jgi:molybdopterin/thiamine biosynthesis adenylyltransferase